MYTADNARSKNTSDLDARIKAAVEEAGSSRTASMRVYVEDWFCRSIEHELEQRGFTNIYVPSITLKGDVSFSW
jgi:hypothetical protein